MDNKKKRMPQNINNLLMEIGEKSVIFQLYVRLKDRPWNAYYNLHEPGCDVVLINKERNSTIKIEVKTRQRLFTTSGRSSFNFTLTENEYNNVDFLVGYWFEKNFYFIVPKNDLKETSSNMKKLFILRANITKDGQLSKYLQKYEGKWDLILNEIDIKS